MLHKQNALTKKERLVLNMFVSKVDIKKSRVDNPIIIAMIGLVGSGKSSVSRELAKHIGATVIAADDIRIELRKLGEHYKMTRVIVEDIAVEVVNRGGSVILDSDFVDEKKRANIRRKAHEVGARLVFIHIYCDIAGVVGRAIVAPYRNSNDDFFGGASSRWSVGKREAGAVVKIREMWRRTPLHYRWVNQEGGTWVPKKLAFVVFAEIDTTDTAMWKREAKKCSEQLLSLQNN